MAESANYWIDSKYLNEDRTTACDQTTFYHSKCGMSSCKKNERMMPSDGLVPVSRSVRIHMMRT